MNQKTKNIFKAFFTGFLTVALLLLFMHIIAPTLGIKYITTFTYNFSLVGPASGKMLYLSLMAPLIVGVIFAIVQFFEDYEGHMVMHYRKVVKTPETEEMMIIVSDTLWGMAIGFVTTMILFLYLMGKTGSYSIPYLFSATAANGTVTGSTALISLFTVLGLAYGIWKATHMKKHKKRKPAKKAKKKKPRKRTSK